MERKRILLKRCKGQACGWLSSISLLVIAGLCIAAWGDVAKARIG